MFRCLSGHQSNELGMLEHMVDVETPIHVCVNMQWASRHCKDVQTCIWIFSECLGAYLDTYLDIQKYVITLGRCLHTWQKSWYPFRHVSRCSVDIKHVFEHLSDVQTHLNTYLDAQKISRHVYECLDTWQVSGHVWTLSKCPEIHMSLWTFAKSPDMSRDLPSVQAFIIHVWISFEHQDRCSDVSGHLMLKRYPDMYMNAWTLGRSLDMSGLLANVQRLIWMSRHVRRSIQITKNVSRHLADVTTPIHTCRHGSRCLVDIQTHTDTCSNVLHTSDIWQTSGMTWTPVLISEYLSKCTDMHLDIQILVTCRNPSRHMSRVYPDTHLDT